MALQAGETGNFRQGRLGTSGRADWGLQAEETGDFIVFSLSARKLSGHDLAFQDREI